MMTRKNNVDVRESNDNVDRKNVVVIGISFCRWSKIFFLGACIKEDDVKIFDTRVYFGPYFWP